MTTRGMLAILAISKAGTYARLLVEFSEDEVLEIIGIGAEG
jgi:hypothetical protein